MHTLAWKSGMIFFERYEVLKKYLPMYIPVVHK